MKLKDLLAGTAFFLQDGNIAVWIKTEKKKNKIDSNNMCCYVVNLNTGRMLLEDEATEVREVEAVVRVTAFL